MGCCSTSPEGLIDTEVSRELNGDKDRNMRIQKLLFLGSGGSGKSTFFKQLRCIHGTGFNPKDRSVYKEHISAQLLEQINRAVECIPYHNERLPEQYDKLQLSKQGEASAEYLENVQIDHLVTGEVASHIEVLWREDAVQQIYQNRAIYHIDDSSAYFFDELQRIGSNEYMPSDMDIMLVRYRTTGVVESSFDIRGSNFHIFDVGGQQSERKKWIHCFENVTAVIFVASLSCYDETMFEDDTTNAMIDSLELFREICNLQWFVATPIILFLNKTDLFEKKIQIIPLSVCFDDEFQKEPPRSLSSTTDHSTNSLNMEQQPMIADDAARTQYISDARNFIKKKFMDSNLNAKRAVYAHITIATNKDNVDQVFNDVQQIVVNIGLARNNLI